MWIQVPNSATLRERAVAGGAALNDRENANRAGTNLVSFSTPAPGGGFFIYLDALVRAAPFIDAASAAHPISSFAASSPAFGARSETTLVRLLQVLSSEYPGAEGVQLSLVTGRGTVLTPIPTVEPVVPEPVEAETDDEDPDMHEDENDELIDDDTHNDDDANDEDEDVEDAILAPTQNIIDSKVFTTPIDMFISDGSGRITLHDISPEYISFLESRPGNHEPAVAAGTTLMNSAKIVQVEDASVSGLPEEIRAALPKWNGAESWNLDNVMLSAQFASVFNGATRFSPHCPVVKRGDALDLRFLQLTDVAGAYFRTLVDKISPITSGDFSNCWKDVLRAYRAAIRVCVHTMTANQLFFGTQAGVFVHDVGSELAKKFPKGHFNVGFAELDHYGKSTDVDETIYDREGRFQLKAAVFSNFDHPIMIQLCTEYTRAVLNVAQSDSFAEALIRHAVFGAEFEQAAIELGVVNALDNKATTVEGMLVSYMSGAKNVADKLYGLKDTVLQTKLLQFLSGSSADLNPVDITELVIARMPGLSLVLKERVTVDLKALMNLLLTNLAPAFSVLKSISAKMRSNIVTALTTYVNVAWNTGLCSPHALIGFRGNDLKNVGLLLPQTVLAELFRQNVIGKTKGTAPKDLLTTKRLRELQKYFGERAWAVVRNLRESGRMSDTRSCIILVDSDGACLENGVGSPYQNEQECEVGTVLIYYGSKTRKVLGSGNSMVVEFADFVGAIENADKSEFTNIISKMGLDTCGTTGMIRSRMRRLESKPNGRPGSLYETPAWFNEKGVTLSTAVASALLERPGVWVDDVGVGLLENKELVSSTGNKVTLNVSLGGTPFYSSMFTCHANGVRGWKDSGNSNIGIRNHFMGHWLGWLHANKIEGIEQSIWLGGSSSRYQGTLASKDGSIPVSTLSLAKNNFSALGGTSGSNTPWYDWPRTGEDNTRDTIRTSTQVTIACTVTNEGNRVTFHQQFCRNAVENLIVETGIALASTRKWSYTEFMDKVDAVTVSDYVPTEFTKIYAERVLSDNTKLVKKLMEELRSMKEDYKEKCRQKLPLARRLCKEKRNARSEGGVTDMERHVGELVKRGVIQGFRVRDGNLRIKTNELNLVTGPAIYLFGEYSINLLKFFDPNVNSESLSVRFWNMTRQIGGSNDHPHVRSGSPCLGNLKGMLATSIKNRDLPTAISLLLGYLQSVNLEDQYGMTMQRSWPYVPCTLENMVKYGVEDAMAVGNTLIQLPAKNSKSKQTVKSLQALKDAGELQTMFDQLLENRTKVLNPDVRYTGSISADSFPGFAAQFGGSDATRTSEAGLKTRRTPAQIQKSFDRAVQYMATVHWMKLPEVGVAVVGQ